MAVMVSIDGHEVEWAEVLRELKSGEELLLTQAGTPVARVVAVSQAAGTKRIGGEDAGKIVIADDFDELPEWLLDAFES